VIAESSAPCSSSPSTCETGTSYGGASNHRDPGDWEWCTYMPRFGGTCKCDDIWNLWNCSSDKTQAFRCDNGNVELEQCTAGCVVEPVGQDDQCNQDPAPPDAGPPPPTDDAGTSASPHHAPGAHQAGDGDQPQSSGGGCSASAASPRGDVSLGVLFAGIMIVARRRRPRR